jgi:hypothetical protein
MVAMGLAAACQGSAARGAEPVSRAIPVDDSKVVGDNEAYSAGAYLAYIAPFNRGLLVRGRDYTESIAVSKRAFPDGTRFEWRWPEVAAKAGVYDFSAIDFGDYDNTVVRDPVPSRRIGEIGALRETHDATFAGELDGFDVIDDLFLTERPGDNATNAFEIEVFLHTPGYSADYVRGARQIGTFEGSGIVWTVALDRPEGHVPDILFMPRDRADLGRCTIDLKAMLSYLVANGTIPETLYFNGFAFGTETQRGGGSMDVSAFAATYK